MIPVVPIEIQLKEGMATTLNEPTKKFKSTGVPENVPVAMAIAKDKICVSASSSHMEFRTGVFADRVEDLKSEKVLD